MIRSVGQLSASPVALPGHLPIRPPSPLRGPWGGLHAGVSCSPGVCPRRAHAGSSVTSCWVLVPKAGPSVPPSGFHQPEMCRCRGPGAAAGLDGRVPSQSSPPFTECPLCAPLSGPAVSMEPTRDARTRQRGRATTARPSRGRRVSPVGFGNPAEGRTQPGARGGAAGAVQGPRAAARPPSSAVFSRRGFSALQWGAAETPAASGLVRADSGAQPGNYFQKY